MKNCIKCLKPKSLNKFESGRNQCQDCRKEFTKSYYKSYFKKNRDELLVDMKIYYDINRNDLISKSCRYNYNRRQFDVNFKLSTSLRSRLSHAIKNNQKSGSAINDLGCSIEELKKRLESQFESGMTWENWSIKGWHIDHIKPLCQFDLSNKEEFLKACNYINLQPIWAEDHYKKSSLERRGVPSR